MRKPTKAKTKVAVEPKEAVLIQKARELVELNDTIQRYKKVQESCEKAVARLEQSLDEANRNLEDTKSLLKAQLEKFDRDSDGIASCITTTLESSSDLILRNPF